MANAHCVNYETQEYSLRTGYLALQPYRVTQIQMLKACGTSSRHCTSLCAYLAGTASGFSEHRDLVHLTMHGAELNNSVTIGIGHDRRLTYTGVQPAR